ncbi:MAG: hypothetical protein GF317_06825 [Candidatus Lokiarchaeota archaeon]|nr:hypothetical protein [Candidatus Lokiarchaeota archaeon]MBD3199423.1 hypothetical protein [Candidatus Lokiarchaeota archaeon]
MEVEEKKIYFILSPHINYYHSYRGDSRGPTGFGKDLEMMEAIIHNLDELEEKGFCNGRIPITWDYADTFWSIQLQQEYQPEILQRVIERCKEGKDEVLIGSWGNVGQPLLDTEELRLQHKWFLENSMGIGVNQLFGNRIAPFARTQETMFTQGMIEEYNKLGVEGLCVYYSTYSFDVARPFLNPRLDMNQQYGLLKLRSSVSDASMLMIPMYAFGDILDFFSIKRWFEFIRKQQLRGTIEGDALLFFNFDMDYENWCAMKNLPNFLRWMPNTKGLEEFAEVVDQYDYIEFGSLIDTIPKIKVYGETILRQDTADGIWNGFYNWAQKYNNTRFWTIGQRSRWLKSISDTINSEYIKSIDESSKVSELLRSEDDAIDSYIRNHILFTSTTNFGMSMPFQHPHRRKTAITYGLKSFIKAEEAVNITLDKFKNKVLNEDLNQNEVLILPVVNRGISSYEKIPIPDFLYLSTVIDPDFVNDIDFESLTESKDKIIFGKTSSDQKENVIKLALYTGINQKEYKLEAIIPKELFKSEGYCKLRLLENDGKINGSSINVKNKVKSSIRADATKIENQHIKIFLSSQGKIESFRFKDEEFGCPNFLESAVSFGKVGKSKRYSPKHNEVVILRDGSDGYSASLLLKGRFEIINDSCVEVEKTLTLYSDLDKVFINVKMLLCDIKGEKWVDDGTSSVEDTFDERWQEIMPCEIKPRIFGGHNYLRIWKKNYLGRVSYFDCDMKEVDSKNKNIDCLVANISDGWMSVSNQEKGLLVGFDALKAANFAFSPLKIKDKGFNDCGTKKQQLRINPFGTYFGKLFHYWTEGSGHAQKIVPELIGTDNSTAPTFSGRTIEFNLLLSPYFGDEPPKILQSFADHYTFPSLVIFNTKNKKTHTNYSRYSKITKALMNEFDVKELMNKDYLEWVREVNADYDQNKPEPAKGLKLNLGVKTLIRLLIDGIRGR